MTLIAGIGFPDEVFIIGDSRASYPKNTIPPKDELKKVYQLASHLFLAYTSSDVKFTFKLIEAITIFISKNKPMETDALLKLIIDFSRKKYLDLSKNLPKQPSMSFIYAGISKKPLIEDKNKIIRLLNLYKNEPYIPEKLKALEIDSTKKYVEIPPPTPILVKQFFPDGHVSATRGWDFSALGSGVKIQQEIEKYYKKLFFFPGGFNKGIILNDMCNQFILDAGIDSIGGIVQIFMINEDGATPIIFEEKSGDVVKRRVAIGTNGDWVEKKDGRKLKSTQNPPKL